MIEFGVNVDFHTIDEIIAVIEKESSAQHDFSAMRLSGFDENRVIHKQILFSIIG